MESEQQQKNTTAKKPKTIDVMATGSNQASLKKEDEFKPGYGKELDLIVESLNDTAKKNTPTDDKKFHSNNQQKFTITTSDDVDVTLDRKIIQSMNTVFDLIKDLPIGDGDTIPVGVKSGKDLDLIIKFLNAFVDKSTTASTEETKVYTPEVKKEMVGFLNNEYEGKSLLETFPQVQTADWLSVELFIDSWIGHACGRIEEEVDGKNPQTTMKQLADVFGFTGEITKEDVEAVIKEHEWLFENMGSDDIQDYTLNQNKDVE